MRSYSVALRLIILVSLVLASAGALTADPVIVTDARDVEVRVEDASRIVSLGSAVTETIVALGAADRLVGVDSSSSYPAEAIGSVPRTGYVRQVAAEGILSLAPSVVIGSVDVGPPEVIEQLENAGVPVVIVPEDDSLEGVIARTRFIARAIGVRGVARELIAEIEADIARARELLSSIPEDERLSVMFIYARGAGTLLVSGSGTSADAMISLAGGVNAVSGYSGYRPLNAEAAIAAAPDVLLLMSSGLAGIGGSEGLGTLPGIAQTPAWQNGRVLDFEGTYLLGFGPRTGKAVYEFATALYGDSGSAP